MSNYNTCTWISTALRAMLFDFKYGAISEAQLDVQLTRHVRKRMGQLHTPSGIRTPPFPPTAPTPG
jgi:hypothetical protein